MWTCPHMHMYHSRVHVKGGGGEWSSESETRSQTFLEIHFSGFLSYFSWLFNESACSELKPAHAWTNCCLRLYSHLEWISMDILETKSGVCVWFCCCCLCVCANMYVCKCVCAAAHTHECTLIWRINPKCLYSDTIHLNAILESHVLEEAVCSQLPRP